MTFRSIDLIDETEQLARPDDNTEFFVYLAGGRVGNRLKGIYLTARESPASCFGVTPSSHQQGRHSVKLTITHKYLNHLSSRC